MSTREKPPGPAVSGPVTVPLITMTALSPAFHFPFRYIELIRLRAAGTDARGFAGSIPVLASFPPEETYHTELRGFWELAGGFEGLKAVFPPVPEPGSKAAWHPAINNAERNTTKKKGKEKNLQLTLNILIILNTPLEYTASRLKKQEKTMPRGINIYFLSIYAISAGGIKLDIVLLKETLIPPSFQT
jgi:hypothetical protein